MDDRDHSASPRAGGTPLRVVAVCLGVVLLLVIPLNGTPSAAGGRPPGKQVQFNGNVSHIVFLLQENHAFDNFFGTYCTSKGPYCSSTANGIPKGTCVPISPTNPSKGCVAPYPFTRAQMTPPDIAHDWHSTHLAYDKGAMDGFYAAEGLKTETFGYYNSTTIPVYWDLAEQYGLGDNFYSPAASYSLPNHWFAVAASAPNISYTVKTEVPGVPASQLFQYLNESNTTPAIEDELARSKTTWKYYDFALGGYNWSTRPQPNSPAYSYWNPLAAREQSYKARDRPHLVPRSTFFTDARNGTLPNISWVIPTPTASDHPPFNLSKGQDWVASVVNALEASPEWNSTVLFVSWDEYGGFYDHVAPPQPDAYGDGFRVPLLAIGPWVKQGYIDHASMDFDSILHLMELRFHLHCLGARDCNASVPLGMFDFSHGPRAPIHIAGYANATYPMALQSSGQLPPYRPWATPLPAPPSETPYSGEADAVLDWS